MSSTSSTQTIRDRAISNYTNAWAVGDEVIIKLFPTPRVQIGGDVTQNDGIYRMEFHGDGRFLSLDVTMTEPITSNVTWEIEFTNNNWKYGDQDREWNAQAVSPTASAITFTPSDYNDTQTFHLQSSYDDDILNENVIGVLIPRHNSTLNGSIEAVAIYMTVIDNTVCDTCSTADPPRRSRYPRSAMARPYRSSSPPATTT